MIRSRQLSIFTEVPAAMMLRFALLCLVAISILPTPLGPSAQMSWTGLAVGAGPSPIERLHDARTGDLYATTKTQRPGAVASAEQKSGTDWSFGGSEDAAYAIMTLVAAPQPSYQAVASRWLVAGPIVGKPGARAPPNAT